MPAVERHALRRDVTTRPASRHAQQVRVEQNVRRALRQHSNREALHRDIVRWEARADARALEREILLQQTRLGLPALRPKHRPQKLRGGNRPEAKGTRKPALRGQTTGETLRAQSEQRGLSLRALNDAFLLFDRGRVLFSGTEMKRRGRRLLGWSRERRGLWFFRGPVHLCAFLDN
jgi:hypothetical protein